MINRVIVVLALAFFVYCCEAGAKNSAPAKGDSTASNELIFESLITTFSTALVKKDLDLLLTVTSLKDIYLVRLFTSGNLGGRGLSLSQAKNIRFLSKELAFDIKNQTPFELPALFSNIPITSVKVLPRRILSVDADTINFDQWSPILKKSLIGAPEAAVGDSVLLRSSKYWVYAEAQIIDDILVGGFAVFEMQDGKLKLVALINLL